MIDSVSNASGKSNSGSESSSGLGSVAGQDTFMKMLVAQISHQDPLNPMDNTAFTAQLAQFSALEQAVETNSRLGAIAIQQTGIANTEVANLVGNAVTVKNSTVKIDSQGIGVPIRYTLGEKAETVKVTVHDSTGKTVRTLELGAQNGGAVSVQWDGKDEAGTAQPVGTYSITIEAKNKAGAPVSVTQETSGKLTSVTFEKGYALLHLDNGVTAPASDLIGVNGRS